MTDFMADRSRSRPEQDAVLHRLSDVVVAHLDFSPVTVVMLAEWNEVNAIYYLRECGANAYAIAAVAVVNKFVLWMGAKHPQDEVHELGFECGDAGQDDFRSFMESVDLASRGQLGSLRPVMVPKDDPRAQAADMLLWTQLRIVKARQTGEDIDVPVPLARILERTEHAWGKVGREHILDWCFRHAVPLRSANLSTRELKAWAPKLGQLPGVQ